MFDDGHLVSCAGLVPVMTFAEQTGLGRLLAEKVRISVPRIKSGAANPAPKLVTVVAGMVAGADCIDDIDVVHSGGMKALFDGVYAPRRSESCCGSSPSDTPVNSSRYCPRRRCVVTASRPGSSCPGCRIPSIRLCGSWIRRR